MMAPDPFPAMGLVYRARLRLAHSFCRVGNAPRVGKHAGERCLRGPLGTRLNEPMPTARDNAMQTARLLVRAGNRARPQQSRLAGGNQVHLGNLAQHTAKCVAVRSYPDGRLSVKRNAVRKVAIFAAEIGILSPESPDNETPKLLGY